METSFKSWDTLGQVVFTFYVRDESKMNAILREATFWELKKNRWKSRFRNDIFVHTFAPRTIPHKKYTIPHKTTLRRFHYVGIKPNICLAFVLWIYFKI